MAHRPDLEKREDIAGLCRRNALHVVKLAWTTQAHIEFDAAGVRWLDRYINESAPHLAEELTGEFVQFMGCFYGECLISEFGGTWVQAGDQVAVHMPTLGYTYPLVAVAKQLRAGNEHSVATAFYTAIEYLTIAA